MRPLLPSCPPRAPTDLVVPEARVSFVTRVTRFVELLSTFDVPAGDAGVVP